VTGDTIAIIFYGLLHAYRQITVVDQASQEADEFLLKVQQAVTGPPWYMESPSVVCQSLWQSIALVTKSRD